MIYVERYAALRETFKAFMHFSNPTFDAQMQPKNASRTAIYLENSSRTSCKTVKEPTVIHGNDLKKDEKFMAGSSPPLDRIDL